MISFQVGWDHSLENIFRPVSITRFFFVLRPLHHCGSQRNSSRSETPVPTPLPSFLVIYLQIASDFNCMFWFDHDDRKICSADGHSWHHVHQSSARPKVCWNCLPYSVFYQKIEWMEKHPQPTLPKSIQQVLTALQQYLHWRWSRRLPGSSGRWRRLWFGTCFSPRKMNFSPT